MLHIITPAYRFENLEKVYNSILMDNDITWHISKSTKREEFNFDFIKNDKRIKVYVCDCEDSDTTIKRNTILNQIKSGYFCFLDDDTEFHENMYMKYKECEEQNFIGMLVGQQLEHNGELRIAAHHPKHRHIDTGNVLSHSKCLENCKWPKEFIQNVNDKDFLFWESVYNFYGKKCAIWNQPISYYNKLSKIDKLVKDEKKRK